jgi:hypothetical protein
MRWGSPVPLEVVATFHVPRHHEAQLHRRFGLTDARRVVPAEPDPLRVADRWLSTNIADEPGVAR